jgi:hypothetical protein
MRSYHFNNGKSVLNNEQIMAVAPSVFADRPYHAVSEKYRFIPTSAVLARLQAEGWDVMQAFENRVRLADKRGFTKHRLVLQQRGAKPLAKVGDTLPRIVLTNGHDRSSAYNVEAGLFRLACLNGMMASAGDFGRVRVQHSGSKDLAERVLEGTYQVVGDMQEITAQAGEMGQIVLTRSEQLAYAESALGLRWDGAAPVTAQQLLTVRRTADEQADLWTTYNRVQENIIRGGLRGVAADGSRRKTRGVNSINEDTRINRALWQLAQSMASIKQAA